MDVDLTVAPNNSAGIFGKPAFFDFVLQFCRIGSDVGILL